MFSLKLIFTVISLIALLVFSSIAFAAASSNSNPNAQLAPVIARNIAATNLRITNAQRVQNNLTQLANTVQERLQTFNAKKEDYIQKKQAFQNATALTRATLRSEAITAHALQVKEHRQHVLEAVELIKMRTEELPADIQVDIDSLNAIECFNSEELSNVAYAECWREYRGAWWKVKKEVRAKWMAYALNRSNTALEKAKTIIEDKIIPSQFYENRPAFKQRVDNVLAHIDALLDRTAYYLDSDLTIAANYHGAKRTVRASWHVLRKLHAWLVKVKSLRDIQQENPDLLPQELEELNDLTEELTAEVFTQTPNLSNAVTAGDTVAIEAEQQTLGTEDETGGTQ